MSQYIEFFVSRSDKMAATVDNRGPAAVFTTVTGSYFDADDAVALWESVPTGRPREDLSAVDYPRNVVPWANDSSAVFALSAELRDHLARADPAALQAITAAWMEQILQDEGDLERDVALLT